MGVIVGVRRCARVARREENVASPRVEFKLLGPIEVTVDGRDVTIGSRKQRTLLSRLRRALDPAGARLVARDGGYLLRAEPDELDVDQFARLVQRGRNELSAGSPEGAVIALRAALGRWRAHPPLAEIAESEFGRARVTELEDARATAVEDLADAELAAARPEAAVDLAPHVRSHPLRERAWERLILAQYRMGRQGDALASFRAVRRILDDELGVEPAVARQVGVVSGSDTDLTTHVADQLRGRRLLLVLDNCQHLLDEAARVAARLLRACPGLTVLTTSREPLGVPGEVIWPVPPLSLPAADALTPDALTDSDAVRLFCQRARAAQVGFGLTTGNAAAVAGICRRLDGIPLALELAAARLRAMSADQVAGRLDDRFALLSAGARTMPRRQQTLGATMDWSYQLLTSEEQAGLRALTVFRRTSTWQRRPR